MALIWTLSARVLCNLACKTDEDFSEMREKVYNECSRLRSKQNSSSMENVDNATEDQYQSSDPRLSERFSLERERFTWEGEILGYTGGFSPE
ncbi:hypothetical protein Lal_00017201 [Lupinus albus]|nr:hypothetical protein Lal_00017201 [Lupinus albus]